MTHGVKLKAGGGRARGGSERTGFARSRKRNCPACGKTNRYHCSITKDATLAICKYAPSDKQAKDGRWIHVLREVIPTVVASRPTLQKSEPEANCQLRVIEAAIAERRDAVYRYMLANCLRLSPKHGDDLLERRGLTDTTIASRLYASAPTLESASEVSDQLAERFSLDAVPGFFCANRRWRMNIHPYNSPGILIPVCDVSGRISAIQIRRDADHGPRYIWLSSAGKLRGVTSGAPAHFAKADLVQQNGRAIITEGPLKADICAEMLGTCFIGVAGVDVFDSSFGATLRADLPDLRELIIAYDADWHTNDSVRKAILRLRSVLQSARLRVKMWDWDIRDGKGLDDYHRARRQEGA